MTLTLGKAHKAVPLIWHQNDTGIHHEDTHSAWTIVGHEASIQVKLHDGTMQEKRVVPNTGTCNLFFPVAYAGDVTVEITGSKSGSEIATLQVF